MLIILAILGSLLKGYDCLQCYSGHAGGNGTLDDFQSQTCGPYEDWCFSMHVNSTELNERMDIKMCWDKSWEHGRYQEDGCIQGQHCLGGVCYNNTVVCLCNDKDLCNGYIEGGDVSTPIPFPPTIAPGGHSCYYSIKESNVSTGVEYSEQCYNTEQLCMVVFQEDQGYEYRSCFDSSFDEEFAKPGCYKGFQHCHRNICHNDTTLCVCAENMCNTLEFSSEAPPITPGSGLYCYAEGWDEYSGEVKECQSDEFSCISFVSNESNHTLRDCWNPATYNKFNFTGCEITPSCWDGSCYNSTVCICQDNLCNDYGIEGKNGTTPEPIVMTTTNNTMHCWYGISLNRSDAAAWHIEVCAPQEDRCILVATESGFEMGQCYDTRYDDGKFIEGTYDTGEHCWRDSCYNGTIYVCTEPMCNDKSASTPPPHPTTEGSNLDCWYGILGDDDGKNKNLTTQICQHNETMCIAVYGEHSFFMGSCWDPTKEDGKYNATDGCVEGLHCWHHEDGTQSCHNGTVCTCDTSMCNSRNASSTLPTETPATTGVDTMRCWFGEKHPYTGEEDWKVETCESTEHYCYQLIHGHGDFRTEARQCWDLAYEDGHYHGTGCYQEDVYHHDHWYNDTTVCICKDPLCNDWSLDGNVTTVEPVTPGSGLYCYTGSTDHYQARPCNSDETMCMLFKSPAHSILDCYNPKSNDGLFVTDNCWDGVQVEQEHGHDREVGRICLCSEDNLCNLKFLGGGSRSNLPSLALVLLLALLPYFLQQIRTEARS